MTRPAPLNGVRNVLAGLLWGLAGVTGLWSAVLLLQWSGLAPEPLRGLLTTLAPFPGDGQPLDAASSGALSLALGLAASALSGGAALLIGPKTNLTTYRGPYRTHWRWDRDDPHRLRPGATVAGILLGVLLILLGFRTLS